MMKSIKNVIELITVLVLIVSISGCTGTTSEKTTEPKTPVSSNEQMLAMTPLGRRAGATPRSAHRGPARRSRSTTGSGRRATHRSSG